MSEVKPYPVFEFKIVGPIVDVQPWFNYMPSIDIDWLTVKQRRFMIYKLRRELRDAARAVRYLQKRLARVERCEELRHEKALAKQKREGAKK